MDERQARLSRDEERVAAQLLPGEVWHRCGAGYVGGDQLFRQLWFFDHATQCDLPALPARLGQDGFETLCRTTARRTTGEASPPSEAEITAFIAARRAAGGHLPEGAR